MIYDLICLCPVRPDLDGLACSVAYAEYRAQKDGTSCAVWIGGPPGGEAQFYATLYRNKFQTADDDEMRAAQRYALLDLSNHEVLPDGIDFGKVIAVIDHRFLHQPQDHFPSADIQLEAVGAAATLVAEKFMGSAIEPSAMVAAMLHGAIYSNTLGLRDDCSTPRDRAAFIWARQYVERPDEMITAQLAARRADIVHDLENVLELETKLYRFLGRPTYFTQLEMGEAVEFRDEYGARLEAQFAERLMPTLLNLVDIARGISLIYCNDEKLRAALSAIYRIAFTDGWAQMPATLRKYISAELLKAA